MLKDQYCPEWHSENSAKQAISWKMRTETESDLCTIHYQWDFETDGIQLHVNCEAPKKECKTVNHQWSKFVIMKVRFLDCAIARLLHICTRHNLPSRLLLLLLFNSNFLIFLDIFLTAFNCTQYHVYYIRYNSLYL